MDRMLISLRRHRLPTALDVAQRVILTRSLAARMFPDRDALGQAVYLGDRPPARVVGIIERLRAPGDGDSEDSALLALRMPDPGNPLYVLRIAPGDPARVRARLAADAARIVPGRLLEIGSAGALRQHHERLHRHRLLLLATGAVLWLFGTGAMVYALSEAMVGQRDRQIALRRALGARVAQIQRQLRNENLLLCGLGIALGAAIAALLRRALFDASLLSPPMPAPPLVALLLLASGWLAMRGPARRAAQLSPAAYSAP